MQTRNEFASVLLCAVLLVSCGGGGNGVFNPPPGAPVVKLSVSSLTFGDQNLNTSSAIQTTTLTNSGNAMLQITGIAISGTNAGDFSESNTCGASVAAGASCTIGVFFKPTATGARTATVAITDNATGSPQTVSLTGTGISIPFGVNPPAATVLLGATQSFTLTAPGSCTATVGKITVAGTAVSYEVPQALPSTWNDTMTCTATSDGTKASASITLQYPVPTISSVNPQTLGALYAPNGASFYAGDILVNGSGFLQDGTPSISPDSSVLCVSKLVSWNQFTFDIAMGGGFACSGATTSNPLDPGFLQVTASDPVTGHGGGISNSGYLAVLGDQNLEAFNSTDAFLLDPASNTVRKFKLADGSPDGSFTFSDEPSGAHAVGETIAVDDVNGDVVLFLEYSIRVFDPTTNAQKFYLPYGSYTGAAKGGWAVYSQSANHGTVGGPHVIGCINLKQPSTAFSEDFYGTPYDGAWDLQVTSIQGSLTAVAWSFSNGTLSTIAIPSLQVTGSAVLTNIATDTTLAGHPYSGGWQLQVFEGGPSGGTAVLLSQYDQVLVYVDLATMVELRRGRLPNTTQSFRLAKKESDGSVAVAFADSPNGQTTLSVVDMGSNTVNPIKTTVPFLATGLQFCGNNLCLGNRSAFAIVPKQ
jgi:Cep192 domain 4